MVGSSELVRHLARSVVATWIVVAAELLVVALACREQITSVWELQFGVLWLAPTVVVACSAAGILGGLLLAALEQPEARWGRTLLGAVSGVFGGLVGWGVGGGRHLASVSTRGSFALLCAAICATAAFVAAPHLAAEIRRRPFRVVVGAALGILALEVINRFVLVRLYPAFHQGLASAALLLAPALTLTVRESEVAGHSEPSSEPASRRRWLGPATVGALALAALITARPAAARLAYFDNLRLLLLEQAPLLGQGVRGAALLAAPAPPPVALDDCGEGTGRDCVSAHANPHSSGPSVDLRHRDILLVTIDALRADHVGAYGYSRNTTPHLDALAKEAALFEHAYSVTPHTSYSISSLMTGKYLRPLLLQGAGQDSDTWADLLRTYGYRTAGFYPPAVFFIDADRFASFRDRHLGFEYYKVEFLEGEGRVRQVSAYLDSQPPEHHLFVWVHLFGPHEPYEGHAAYDFGERDIDRYDAEIAAADATAGKIVRKFRKVRPSAVVIVTSDHGEEFGDHGGRYHGTTVYEEQVRVPLLVSAPGAIGAGRIAGPVQTIDLLPTVLAGLDIPVPPRLRGRDLGSLLAGSRTSTDGLALAETEEFSLLARGPLRLVCARRVGACRLYDVVKDPGQQQDIASVKAQQFEQLRQRLRQLSASHGRYEVRGLRAEGKGWPAAILRGASGDGEAAGEIAGLLDDANPGVRRKAAELLFQLKRPKTAAALRLALSRDEDTAVRRWCALALTRMGQGAPLAFELAKSKELRWRRLAALALAEAGDRRGEATLVAWWKDAKARDYQRSRELLDALAKIRSSDAVWPLAASLGDVRLRPHIAVALARIGEDVARVPLARALAKERYQSARVAIAQSLVELGAEAELAQPLVRFLGVPDPLPGGLGFAHQAGILDRIGGPSARQLRKLADQSELGAALDLVVPRGGNGKGVRALLRARTAGQSPRQISLGARLRDVKYNAKGEPIRRRDIPRIDPQRSVKLQVPPGPEPTEIYATLPESMQVKAGRAAQIVVFAHRLVQIEALALVPLSDELPPPPPEPWEPEAGQGTLPSPSRAGGIAP